MSHSSSFERWLISPVWIRKAGCVGIALILSIASVSVARGSGLGGRWKPIWLSLIWTKVSSPCGASAAAAPPIRPRVRGTPPLRVHTTPVPAQVMHFNRPRRLMFGPLNNSFSSRSAISVSLLAWGATPIQTAIPTGLFPRLMCPTAHRSLQKRARAAVQLRADRWSEHQRCRKPAFTCDPAPHSLRQHRLERVVAAPKMVAERRQGMKRNLAEEKEPDFLVYFPELLREQAVLAD